MKIVLVYLFAIISLTFISNIAWAQAPHISYTTSSIVFTDGTAISPLSPSNSGGSITGGYSIPANFAPVPTPYGVVTDPTGTIYAIDNGDAVLYKITSAGATTKYNTATTYTPVGIAIDNNNGFIYITDSARSRVYPIITSTGKYTGTAISSGNINAPCGVAVDASGNIYVVNRGNNKVTKTVKGAASASVILSGFNNPYGIAIDGSGNIFVSEYGSNSIIKIVNGTTGGTTKSTFATGFNKPSHLSFDASGNLYVADNGTNTIKEVTPAGVVSTFLSSGMNLPLQVAFDSSSPQIVYEADNGSGYINKSFFTNYSINIPLPTGLSFDTSTGIISGTPTAPSPVTAYTITAYNGSGSSSYTINMSVFTPLPAISYTPSTNSYFVGNTITTLSPVNTGGTVHSVSFNATGTQLTGANLQSPWGMTIDPSGNIYVANASNGTISKYSSAGVWITDSFGGTFTTPSGLVFDSSGNAYVCDEGAGTIYKVTKSTGVTSALITGLFNPWSITIDASNNLYVAENSNEDVLKFSTNGGSALLTIKGGSGNGPTITGPVGVATDPTGNIYVLNFNSKQVFKYNSIGTYQTTAVNSGLSFPLALAVDDAGNVYVGDQSANGHTSLTGFVNVYNQSGVLYTTITGINDPEGLAIDVSGNLYVSSQTNATVYKYTPTQGYFINPSLPPGLIFNGNNGQFSGKPTTSFPPTNYTVTAYNTSGSGSTVVTLSCYRYLSWVGSSSSTNWALASNWSPAFVPTSADTVRIGSTATFTKGFPVISSAAAAASVTFGTQGTLAAGITVNSGSTLTVLGAITYQSDSKSNQGFTAQLTGAGTITANSINVIANTTLTGQPYTEALSSSITNLNITQNIALTSTEVGSDIFNASFNITGGTALVGGAIQTTNTSGATSSFTVTPTTTATLQLGGASALSGLSSSGANVVTFNNPGTTIEYSGAAQKVYTDASITGLAGGISYTNIKFSGTGIKTASTGNLNISGDFTNTLANDAGDYVDLSSPAVNFNGITQNLAGGSGSGTTLYNVNFSGSGTKTINSGNVNVASSGVLTMSGTAALATGGFLTLNSDATGCAAIAPITSGAPITGNVNVQRYISGIRGYRLLSSPVYSGTDVHGNNVYSLTNLTNNLYVTGSGSGFPYPGNPTIYLYDEGFVPQFSTFLNSNFIGVATLPGGNTPAYGLNANGAGLAGTYTVPVGNGYDCFFRGNLLTQTAAALTTPAAAGTFPTESAATTTATGTLNQGPVTFKDWYTPSSTTLGSVSQLFNLVGNPYASAIDLNTMQSASTTTGIYATPLSGGSGITSFIYELIPTGTYAGQYGVWTVGGTSATATGGASQFIASGEGFFVQATGTSTLIFNESAKATSTNANSFGVMARRLNAAAINPAIASPLLRLKMALDTTYAEETLIQFKPAASTNYVFNEDAPHRAGSGPVHFASRSADSIALTINSMPLQISQTIPLNVYAQNDGVYTINMTQPAPLPALYDVWLMDGYKKDSLDIKNNPTYSFDISNADANSYGSGRFTLVIRQNPALMIHLLDFTAAKTSGGAQVVWQTENEQNYTNFTVERSTDNGATYTDLGGFASDAAGSYSFLDKAPPIAADQYRLKIKDLNGTISYSPAVTLMYANTSNSKFVNQVNVYPNPTGGTINLSIVQNTVTASGVFNVTNPAYNIVITNSMGSIIKTATSTQTQWNDDVSTLLPGVYFVQVVNANDKTVIGKTKFVKL